MAYFDRLSVGELDIGGVVLKHNENTLQVLASDKTVVFDVPRSDGLTGMHMLGRVLWLDTPANISAITQSYTDTNTDRSVTSATTNVDLSSYVPSGLTNVRGALVAVRGQVYVNEAKTDTDCYAEVIASVSPTYNVAPVTYAYIALVYQRIGPSDDRIQIEGVNQAVVPVAWSGKTPYITWNTNSYFSYMSSASGDYQTSCSLYLQGFLS